MNDHISFNLGRGRSSDHLSRVNCQKKKNILHINKYLEAKFLGKRLNLEKNVQNITYKPDPYLNSGEYTGNRVIFTYLQRTSLYSFQNFSLGILNKTFSKVSQKELKECIIDISFIVQQAMPNTSASLFMIKLNSLRTETNFITYMNQQLFQVFS